MKTPKELQSLKEKMRAIQSGDYDVEAENPKIVRCWERLKCDKTDCPAYGKLRCWSIAGTCCHGEVTGKFAKKIKDCRECVVYKESCGGDIGELIEAFNLMVREIRHDFAERVRTDLEKARSERLTEIGDMVAGVAHETRNPLHSIGMATSFLKKKYHDELMDEFLGIIEEEVRKLNDLTAVFLDFSNPAPLHFRRCRLNDIINSIIEQYGEQAERQQISVRRELDQNMPEFASDEGRLADLISCLIENGLEASGEKSTITVTTARENGRVCLSVRDEGPGIPAAEQEKIFRPFYTTKANGPGLGLAIVERIVRELQGTVTLTSKEGEGAQFTVCLPLEE